MTQFTFGLTRRLGHGAAFSQVLRVPSPAAGAGFTYTNDGYYWEYVDSLSFQLATDGNAGNRLVDLTVQDGNGVTIATVPPAAATTASKTAQYTYLDNYSQTTGATDGPFLNTFPGVFLQPEYKIVVTIGAVQVGDQISDIRLYAERFVTGEQGYLLGVFDEEDPRVLAWLTYRRLAA